MLLGSFPDSHATTQDGGKDAFVRNTLIVTEIISTKHSVVILFWITAIFAEIQCIGLANCD